MHHCNPHRVRNMTTGKYLQALIKGKPKWTSDKHKALTMYNLKDTIDMLRNSSVSRDEWITETLTAGESA